MFPSKGSLVLLWVGLASEQPDSISSRRPYTCPHLALPDQTPLGWKETGRKILKINACCKDN